MVTASTGYRHGATEHEAQRSQPGLLEEIVDAFNRRDLDAIVDFFADDGVFQTARGEAPNGRQLVGKQSIREYLEQRYRDFPDWQWLPIRNWTAGDRGVAEWKVVGTDATGKRFEWMGCDLFEFQDGWIKVKDTFWKGP